MISDHYWDYIIRLFNEVPLSIYVILVSVFCGCSFALVIYKQKKTGVSVIKLMLLEYTVLIYCTTLIFRDARETSMFRLEPFWSYKVPSMRPENVMNVAVFVILGILIALSFKLISWWKVVLIGFFLSFSIELMQYSFKRGSFDIDDLISNTLGAFIGSMICLSIQHYVK